MAGVNVTDFTVDGNCSSCGQCCSNLLPLSALEVAQIKKYVKKHNLKEQRHNVISGLDMTCPFRDEANRVCTIYEIRPAICRQFLCNYSKQVIEQTRDNFHLTNKVILMRQEFFGSDEDSKFMKSFLFDGLKTY